jgi:hypothetical protein
VTVGDGIGAGTARSSVRSGAQTHPTATPSRALLLRHARRLGKDYKRLCATSEALVLAAMSRLMARRLARARLSNGLKVRLLAYLALQCIVLLRRHG